MIISKNYYPRNIPQGRNTTSRHSPLEFLAAFVFVCRLPMPTIDVASALPPLQISEVKDDSIAHITGQHTHLPAQLQFFQGISNIKP